MFHVKEDGSKTFAIELGGLDPRFTNKLDNLCTTYGEDFEKLNGFHNSNLNFSHFIDNFIDSAVVADATIDANANNATHDICTLMNDMMKPHAKLLSFNKIYYEACKRYGQDLADKWIEGEWNGESYLHNAVTSSFKPYCFAYDLDVVAEHGLPFIEKFKPNAPKHLTTFNNHVLEFISWTCNRSSGAVGLPSYLVYSWYFWNKDVKEGFYLRDPEYYRRQSFQQVIYDLQQPYLRVTECAFTNFSIMDREYLTELFGGRQFPDGTFAIDHIEEILEHQKVFMEVVEEIRSEMMYTFPVLTYALLYQDGKFVDEEFARWCCNHNLAWYDSNFYVGSDVSSLSNCCFSGQQMVTVRVGGTVIKGPFKNIYQTFNHREVEVFYKGEWKKASLTALEEKHPMFEIKTAGGRSLIATDDHIHLTEEKGEVKSHHLEVGMHLLLETYECEKIDYSSEETDEIVSIERVDYDDDWVFCVNIKDSNNAYFTLTNGIQTHNCRLISNMSKLDAFINSIGGTSLSIGSVQVNTINLRRIALMANGDEDKYMEILGDHIDTCVKILDCVRHIIVRNNEKGLLPNYKHKIIDIDKQYNTIGITSMYETLNEFGYINTDEFGNKSYSEKGMAFASRIMKKLNEQKEWYGFDYSINIENVPGENCNVLLSYKDSLVYPDSEKYNLYSNQWIPLVEKCTLKEKVRLGAILDRECGGGQISHINLESRFANFDQAWDMLNYIASQGVIYFAYNTKISVCEDEHAFYGETCPRCGKKKADTYTRVVGFLTPVSSWKENRRVEFNERKWFDSNAYLSINDSVTF